MKLHPGDDAASDITGSEHSRMAPGDETELRAEVARMRSEIAALHQELHRERRVRDESKSLSEQRVADFKRELLRCKEEVARMQQATPHTPEQDRGRVKDDSPHRSMPTTTSPARPAAEANTFATSQADAEIASRRQAFQRGNHHQTNCALCSSYYTLLKREHHCRLCYLSVCSECSAVKGSGSQRSCEMCIVSNAMASSYWTRISAASKDMWVAKLRTLTQQVEASGSDDRSAG